MNIRISGRAGIAAAVLLFILVIVFMKKGERIKGVAFFLGWLVPGAGHVLLGQWKKGLFFFGILGVTYLFGMWIAGFRPVTNLMIKYSLRGADGARIQSEVALTINKLPD